MLHNLVRAVQPWLACKNGRLFILLSNIPAWQLSQSIPGWMSSFHNNFQIQVDFRCPPPRITWGKLLIYSFFCRFSSSPCPNVCSETKHVEVLDPSQMEELKQSSKSMSLNHMRDADHIGIWSSVRFLWSQMLLVTLVWSKVALFS